MAGHLSASSATTKSDADVDATDDSKKRNVTDELMSEAPPPPGSEEPAADEDGGEDDASEMLQMFHSQQDTQAWRWEQQWVEIERSFVAPPLRLQKWVRIPVKGNKISKKNHVTVEKGKDGTKILVGGFMEYYCPHPGCGKVFPAVGSLRKHMHIHGEKLFICDHCGKRFLDNSKLKRHTAIHFRETAADTTH